MLVVKIELWPLGCESRKKTLAVGHIINDGSGSMSSGNYRIELFNAAGRLWKTGRVEKFPRRRLLAWDLLCRALTGILGPRNKITESATKEAP
jgi:hypothetical protein